MKARISLDVSQWPLICCKEFCKAAHYRPIYIVMSIYFWSTSHEQMILLLCVIFKPVCHVFPIPVFGYCKKGNSQGLFLLRIQDTMLQTRDIYVAEAWNSLPHYILTQRKSLMNVCMHDTHFFFFIYTVIFSMWFHLQVFRTQLMQTK